MYFVNRPDQTLNELGMLPYYAQFYLLTSSHENGLNLRSMCTQHEQTGNCLKQYSS